MTLETYEGPTQEYRDLSENPEKILAMTDEELLKHFLLTRLMIETDTGMPTNKLRMQFVFRVARVERAEILHRMKSAAPEVCSHEKVRPVPNCDCPYCTEAWQLIASVGKEEFDALASEK